MDAYALVFTFDRSASDPAAQVVNGLFSGMGSFSRNISGVLVEASEPVSSGFETAAVLPFDNTAGRATALVLLNPDPFSYNNVQLTIRDNQGELLAQDVIVIEPGAKQDVSLLQAYPQTAGKSGQVYFSADGSFLTSIGLRVNSTGAFSTLLPSSLDSRLMQ